MISELRAWSPLFGSGTLVSDSIRDQRFRRDDGHEMTLDVVAIAVGRPDYARRSQRSSKVIRVDDYDEFHWMTLELRDGSALAFRREGPPPPDGPFRPLPAHWLSSLTTKGRAAYDEALRASKQEAP